LHAVDRHILGEPLSRSFSRHLTAAVLALLLPASLWGATTPNAPEPPAHPSLAGQLLVASPAMGDRRFAQTVILMVRHDHTGAMGLIINRPVGEQPLARLLEAFGANGEGASGHVRVFVGGPVQTELGFVLHSAEYRRPETVPIDARFAMTASRDIFRDMAGSSGPNKSLFAFGYSGWGPGQLEGELKVGAWFTAPADPALVFDAERDKVWELAVERRTRDL
jgi:putative transcriptional regulator